MKQFTYMGYRLKVDEHLSLGDHVTTDSGTGCVHTAPGFGEDDYNVG